MATEATIVAQLLAKHPDRLSAKVDAPWEPYPVFPTVERKRLYILDARGGQSVRNIDYWLFRTVNDLDSVRVDGGALTTTEEKARVQLFRELLAELASDKFLAPLAQGGHRGVRVLVQHDSPSAWVEVVGLETPTVAHRLIWLQADHTLGISAPVDLTTVAPHLLT